MTRPLEVHVQSPAEPTVQAALLLQSDLAKLGVEIRIVKSLWPTIVATTKTPETTPDMWIHWTSPYYVDPENYIGEMYDSANWGTWKASSWYKNSQVEELLRQARSSVVQEERGCLYADACRIVTADAPDIWATTPLNSSPWRSRCKDFNSVWSARDRSCGRYHWTRAPESIPARPIPPYASPIPPYAYPFLLRVSLGLPSIPSIVCRGQDREHATEGERGRVEPPWRSSTPGAS